jgi:RNA polymerase sigma-70 factor (ECF subfamily)
MTTGGHLPERADYDGRQVFSFGGRPGRRGEDLSSAPSDEELMRRLADGEPDALGPLYGRHVRLVLSVANQSLEPAAAEDLVQEVFLAVWRRAATFDPQRAPFRVWLLQIAHSHVLNELRRRGRRPRLVLPDQADDHLRLLEDPMPEPVEAVLRGQRQDAVDEALAALPPEQQRALRLAFYAEMTHEQVAASTEVPLGTAKSRIRSGLRRLRSQLNPLLVGGVAVVLVAGGVVYQQEHDLAARNARALWHVTMSDVQAVRLEAVGGAPLDAHGIFRARDGADIAVLTVSNLAPLGEGRAYQAWARIDGSWRSLGTVPPTNADGRALLIAEGSDLGTRADAVMVTEEPAGSVTAPSDRVVISWLAP